MDGHTQGIGKGTRRSGMGEEERDGRPQWQVKHSPLPPGPSKRGVAPASTLPRMTTASDPKAPPARGTSPRKVRLPAVGKAVVRGSRMSRAAASAASRPPEPLEPAEPEDALARLPRLLRLEERMPSMELQDDPRPPLRLLSSPSPLEPLELLEPLDPPPVVLLVC